MAVNVVLIPFLLTIDAYVSPGTHVDAEFLYEFNRTTIVHREPLQAMQSTCYINCHAVGPATSHLRCFLHDINFVTTLKYKNVDKTEEVANENVTIEQVFEMTFNNQGLKNIQIEKNATNAEISFVKHIGQQFNISVGDMIHGMRYTNNYKVKERTPIGDCMTTYNMSVTDVETPAIEYGNTEFHIKPATLSAKFFEKNNIHIHIAKNRKNCAYSPEFSDFLNGMEVANYTHKLEVIDEKLKILTTLNVQLPPDDWNPAGSPVFTEISQLNLIRIRSTKTEVYRADSEFISYE